MAPGDEGKGKCLSEESRSRTRRTGDQRDRRWRPQDAVYCGRGFLRRHPFSAWFSQSHPADRRASSEAALVILPFHRPASPSYLGSSEGQRLQRPGPVGAPSSPFHRVEEEMSGRGRRWQHGEAATLMGSPIRFPLNRVQRPTSLNNHSQAGPKIAEFSSLIRLVHKRMPMPTLPLYDSELLTLDPMRYQP